MRTKDEVINKLVADGDIDPDMEVQYGTLTARVVPYSSVVGSIVTLHDHKGRCVVQLGLHGQVLGNLETHERTPARYKQESIRLATAVAERLNRMPYALPQSEGT